MLCKMTHENGVFKHCRKIERIPADVLQSFRNWRRPEPDTADAIKYVARTIRNGEWNGEVEFVKSDPSEAIR